MFIKPFKQARRYAQAFLNSYEPMPSQDFLRNYQSFLQFIHENPKIIKQFSSLMTNQSTQQNVFFTMVAHFKLEAPGQQLIKVLLEHKRINLLSKVVAAIIQEGTLRRQEFSCDIATSHNLSETSKELLCSTLGKKLNGTLVPTFHQDPTLIQGIRVTGKTFLWENSIAKKLKACMAFIARQE